MSDQAEPRFSSLTVRLQDWWSDGSTVRTGVLVLLVIYLLVSLVLGFIWSSEPDAFAVRESANSRAEAMGVSPVTGHYARTSAALKVSQRKTRIWPSQNHS